MAHAWTGGSVRHAPALAAKAQQTWAETHDKAVEEYGEGERAHRTAYASLTHSFEKGDHREPKNRPGPSDQRSEQATADRPRGVGRTAGGVDIEGQTREELYERAKHLAIVGRSKMTKQELGEAIARKQG